MDSYDAEKLKTKPFLSINLIYEQIKNFPLVSSQPVCLWCIGTLRVKDQNAWNPNKCVNLLNAKSIPNSKKIQNEYLHYLHKFFFCKNA